MDGLMLILLRYVGVPKGNLGKIDRKRRLEGTGRAIAAHLALTHGAMPWRQQYGRPGISV